MSLILIYNKEKYIRLRNNNKLKFDSLESNVYFTLRDIFMYVSNTDLLIEGKLLVDKLTNNIIYEERTESFKYYEILTDRSFLLQIYQFLLKIDVSNFNYKKMMSQDTHLESKFDYDDITIEKLDYNYIKFTTWLTQFNNLIKSILIRLKNFNLIECKT